MEKTLKQFRLNKGYSLTELAYLSNISVSYLSKLENGKQNSPSLDVIYNIANALELDMTDIIYTFI